MVFYRKYRPQTLEEIIGQEQVKQTLKKAALNGTLAHAYLLCGPRGTGKTSTARILAKIVNCEAMTSDITHQMSDEIPCNKCDSCIAITDATSLDLIEIDAASNRGIDDIRQLRENIKLTPTQSKKKVYIIDEVHMLTTEAFNALLKTLEEPPTHAFFVLATTEPQKIPATILSRVQRLDFQQATTEDLLQALKKVVKAEKLEVEDDGLELIAERAEGSFRDSLKLLDQLASANEKITLQLVEESLKAGSNENAINLLQALTQKDSSKALSILHSQLEKGVNLKEFTLTILHLLRCVLLAQYGAKTERLEKLSTISFQTTEIIALINSFQTALEKMKIVSIQVLPLEVAVVENCLERADVRRQTPDNTSEDQRQTTGDTKISEETREKLEQAKKEEMTLDTRYQISDKLAEDRKQKNEDIISGELTKLLDKWTYILETIKPYNYSLEAMLRQVKVKSCEEGAVVLEVPYSFHQRILEAPKSRDLLESVISDILGKAAHVRCVIGQRPVRVEEVANVELAADDEIIRVAAEIFNS